MMYNKSNRDLSNDPTLITAKVGQHLTKCMDYHQIKTVIITIAFIISKHCCETVQMVQPSTIYSFNHLVFFPKVK